MREEDAASEHPAEENSYQGHATGIDWAQVHLRLEAAQTALERRLTPSLDTKQKILGDRAKRLAREANVAEAPTQLLNVVEFLLAYEHYGIESSYVREVFPLMDVTSLPRTPAFVLGLINMRGQVLSIIDIKKFFDLPEKGLTDLNKVIIVRRGQMELGILADAILGVRSFAPQELQPSLPTLTGIRAGYLRGVTKDPLVVLDVEKLLSDGRIVVDEDADRSTNGSATKLRGGEPK